MKTQRLTELLTRLIATPSVNPAHSDDPSITGEARMADLLTSLLEERGLTVERLEPLGPDRPALLARGPRVDGPSLMFDLHLDTVGVNDMTVDPFRAEIRNGTVTGRGSSDMKGPMAALLTALSPDRVRRLAGRGVNLMVVCTPNEECGLDGATRLAKQGLRADFAVAMEPTRCQPVVAHKGVQWCEIDLRGRSGHGSNPASGVSTNAALALFLPRMLEIQRGLAHHHIHPLLGSSTLNIGRIEGGRVFNIIPERTRLRIDRRVVPNEPAEAFPDAVKLLIRDLAAQGHLCSGECRTASRTNAFATDPDSELATALGRAIFDVTGEEALPTGSSWVSDATPFSQVCGQTLVFGPGDIAQAHTDNEFIEIEQLERGVRILESFLDHFDPQ